MRYKKAHNQTVHERILSVASRRFREDGLAASGLARVMSDAGLTNGAFYTHFESKDDLIRQVILQGTDQQKEAFGSGSNGAGLREAIQGYLSIGHRDDPSEGCQLAAYGAEVARHSRSTRNALTKKVTQFIELVADQLQTGSKQERYEKATALYGMMIGTLQLSRAVSDRKLSDEILESGLKSAYALIGSDHSGSTV